MSQESSCSNPKFLLCGTSPSRCYAMYIEWVTNVNYTTLMEVATSKLIEHGDMSETQTLEEIRVIDNTY